MPWTDVLLAEEHWPVMLNYDEIAAANFERIQALVSEARYVTAEMPGNNHYRMVYQNDSLIEDNKTLIKNLADVISVDQVDQPVGLRLAASNREAWLDIPSETLYEHQSNLEMRLAKTRQQLENLNKRLANENYIKKAPAELVEETKQEVVDTQKLIDRLKNEIEVLN